MTIGGTLTRPIGVTGGQLDLFAEYEATEQQRRAAEAPSLFNTGAQGYFARIAALEQWKHDYGNFDCYRRSHAWHAELTAKAERPTGACRPTILMADLRCDHLGHDCMCVGDLIYRGACLHCTWEGPVRDDENPAAEDAHDHAWPGWRELPIAPRRPESGTNAKQNKAMARWIQTINNIYPAGWLQAGGPIRTSRRRYGTRHVPNHTGFGGYDLCGEILEQLQAAS